MIHDDHANQLFNLTITSCSDALKPNMLKGTQKSEMPALKLDSYSFPSQNVKDSLLFLYLNINKESLVFKTQINLVRILLEYHENNIEIYLHKKLCHFNL